MPTTKPRTGALPRQTKEVLFIQGGGKNVHEGWDRRLVTSLERGLGPGYTVRYPRMPDEGRPRGEAWKRTIAGELGQMSDGAIFVGHSVGAAIALDFLAGAALGRRVGAIFLVAVPFIGDGGWPSDELRPTKQLAVDLGHGRRTDVRQDLGAGLGADLGRDLGAGLGPDVGPDLGPHLGGEPGHQLGHELARHPRHGVPLYLYFGGDDETVPPAHAHLFERTFPRARIAFLKGRDHQLNDDLSEVARDIKRLPGDAGVVQGPRS
jgi:pimeloyl-ACP methyl ester carboxylesterase